MIKSYSWNVNGLRACAEKGFLDWVETTAADFICIQEIKLQEPQLTDELRHPIAYNGSATIVSGLSPKGRAIPEQGSMCFASRFRCDLLGISEFDIEGRTVIADYGGFLIMSAYFPNSQEAGMRLDYKLRFCDAILDFCNFERSKGKHVIVAGDYNIAHKPIDLARPEQNEGNAGYLPEERAWMDKFTSIGYIDTFRLFCKELQIYMVELSLPKGQRKEYRVALRLPLRR